jgi:hypothetical protein
VIYNWNVRAGSILILGKNRGRVTNNKSTEGNAGKVSDQVGAPKGHSYGKCDALKVHMHEIFLVCF